MLTLRECSKGLRHEAPQRSANEGIVTASALKAIIGILPSLMLHKDLRIMSNKMLKGNGFVGVLAEESRPL